MAVAGDIWLNLERKFHSKFHSSLWAITDHTDERFNHVDIAKAADCMGHDVVTHRKHYLKWVGEEQNRKRAMSLNIPTD